MDEISATDPVSNIVSLMNYLDDVFPDLLKGDFSHIEQEGYWEFEKNVQKYAAIVLQLPINDPVRKKYLNSDLSWVSDMSNRLSVTVQHF